MPDNTKREIIYLAGGCFWGTEKYLQSIKGVLSTRVGYALGKKEGYEPPLRDTVTYDEVCRHSGHAETVEVAFDSHILPLPQLLREYSYTIDPTSLGRQGMDIGIQYRTGIYYTDDKLLPLIRDFIIELQDDYDLPVVIEVLPLRQFVLAEEYHQKYLDKNPRGYCHINFEAIKKKKEAIVDGKKYTLPQKEYLRESLTPLQYAVTQENATEPPFLNEFWDNEREGLYVDITTGEPLFSSEDKFPSSCGWPSFSKPVDPNVITEYDDVSHDMVRTEARSRAGNAHLGHIFGDGPKERGGLRYCINSAALRFIPKEELEKEGYGYLIDKIGNN